MHDVALEADTARFSRHFSLWLGAFLCLLLWVAPCAAADGRWFLNEAVDDAIVAQTVAAPTLCAEFPFSGDGPRIVELAPGVIVRNLTRPEPPLPEISQRPVLDSCWRTLSRSFSPPSGETPQPYSDAWGRGTHLRICVLLI